ncbi:hypothetical protein SBRCBS47491_009409 [Sporothrix bragantina]|uniref:Uncharacterized protein n=1 Tax=Sporothrix bragantina TaxID=671064 RepID=A0ABP0CVG3_9PEZI
MTTAAPNATTGTGARVGWVSPDAHRSTWGIIWSCLTVFLICSWKCAHLNLPTHQESAAGWHTLWNWVPVWPRRAKRRMWARKLGWMAMIAIAPEYVVGVAVGQYLTARDTVREFGERYSLAHDTLLRETFKDSGVVVTRDDIQCRSKADAFTKAFAVCQCGWLVVQSVARAAAGLAITQLELTTMAFVLCAVVTYLLWWDKPLDADQPIVFFLPGAEEDAMARLLDLRFQHAGETGRMEDVPLAMIRFLFLSTHGVSGVKVYTVPLAVYGLGTVFSAVHLAAWNWSFPSPLIQKLWRAFAIIDTVWPLLSVVVYVIDKHPEDGDGAPEDEEHRLRTNVCIWFRVILPLAYVLARLGLWALTFYCFSSMPESVYDTVTWTGYLPHVS